MKLFHSIEILIQRLMNEFDKIDSTRKELLLSFASEISEKLHTNTEVNLTFICTHNSRRSHFGQIWAQTASAFYGIKNLNCFSGGTETTAFNIRAVQAIINGGFEAVNSSEDDNPKYLVSYSYDRKPIECFSKVYNDKFNPQKNYIAIMTCSHADENCPIVFGADSRFPIRYDDPKEFDDTLIEQQKYKERFEQIGREMLFAFNNVIMKN